MKTYNITIEDNFDGKQYTTTETSGTKKQALQNVIDFYSQELDTDENGLNIISCNEI
jgi:hypothetical protein